MGQTIARPQRQDRHGAIGQSFGTQQPCHGPHGSIPADSDRSARRIQVRQTAAKAIVIDKKRRLYICIL
jgi:hypothetical protein